MGKICNRHGKEIDLGRLKANTLACLEGHLSMIQSMTLALKDKHKPVQQETCYVCGSEAREPFSNVYDFEYVRCLECNHLYTTERYCEEDIHSFYSRNKYYSQITYANKETCYYRRENVARPKAEFVEKFVKKDGGRRWLDVGSGIGDLVSVLTEKGWQAEGLELSESSVAFAREVFDVTLIQSTMKEYVKDSSHLPYDVVSFIGVLEHVVDPMEHLQMASGVLNGGGLVMIQVPNAFSLTSHLQNLFPRNVFRHMNPLEHIMLFSRDSLCRSVEITGFEPVGFWWHGMDVYELLNNLTLINPETQGSEFARNIMQNMNELQFVLDGKELSDRIICVARKK